MGVTIVIVNYNTPEEVRLCIESIFRLIKDIQFEIIIVDNNSSDRGIELLKDCYPLVKFELLNENVGYSKANNYAVKFSQYEFVLFLNPDTVLIENFLSPFLEFVNSKQNIGACGPMLVYKDLSFQNSWGYKLGMIYETAEAFLFINFYRKLLKKLNSRNYLNKIPFEVNWMSGACLFMKKDLFEKVNGFNEDFFLNYEDIDLCKRVTDLGYKNYYFPELKCIHLDQTTQKKDYEKFTYSRYVSRLIYSKHNYNFLKAFFIRVVHIWGILLRIFTVNILYKGPEKVQRKAGYIKAMKLYLGLYK